MEKAVNWAFYQTSEEAWQAMLFAIEGAKETIDLEQYIFSYDSVGMTFIDALKERAKHGVKVRIFCDAVGSFSLANAEGVEDELRAAGIEIKIFNAIRPWHPNNESIWYFRDHRKLMVIDRRLGFTGGICLSEDMRGWRDSYVKVEGPVVHEMHQSFEVMWRKVYHKFHYYFKRHGKNKNQLPPPSDFSYLTNAPLPGKRYMYRELIKRIRAAKHYIYLTTPYLLPDSRLLRSLKRAVKRGVEVRILVPLKNDVRIMDLAMGTFFHDFLTHGVRLFRYSTNVIHGKTGIIDGLWSTIGSLNLDNLSLRYNFEGNIVSTNKEFTFELERQFLDDLKQSQELTLEDWDKRPFLDKIFELIIWPLRKFL